MSKTKLTLYKKKTYKKHRISSVFCLIGVLVSLLPLYSCKDDVLLPGDNNFSTGSYQIATKELPGVFGLNIRQNGNPDTRADNATSDGNTFNDGTKDEFELATPNPEINEYYHYLLIYDISDASSTPVIFPIDVSNANYDRENPNNNITLTISKVFTKGNNGAISDSDPFEGVENQADLSNYLKNKQAYVLLNFKLVDSDNQNYKLNDNTITGDNTLAKLMGLTRSQLEAIQMLDYRIHGIHAPSVSSPEEDAPEDNPGSSAPSTAPVEDFFIMTNSVYSNGSSKVIDGTFNSNNIFTTEDEALANPALTAHVERLACKFTVSFDSGKLKAVKFGPSEADSYEISDVTIPASDGLPVITTKVRKVDMVKSDKNSGIQFTENGYEIMWNEVTAKIKILGFGISNLEPSMHLFKNINNTYGTTWSWNDPTNFRCYWAQDPDPHYALTKSNNGNSTFTKILGYPHQFRKALDTDSVTSFHSGGYIYDSSKPWREDYNFDKIPYEAFAQIGKIDKTQTIANQCYLTYKTFEKLNSDFNGLDLLFSRVTTAGGVKTTFEPFYGIENTYIDQGMLTNTPDTWRWPWQRAPYATATNLMILAQIEIEDNYASEDAMASESTPMDNFKRLTRDGESASDFSNVRTVYLGQNNIFYLRKVNLLKSKLEILNQVMLSGGNAGIQILNGNWDSHSRPVNALDDEDAALLDKVAWNENSKLWFAKVKWDDNTNGPEYDKKEITDENGKVVSVSYQLHYEEEWPKLVTIDNSDGADENDQYLNLIPAEISGGDGQCLIAPNEKYMGKLYRYYLAPEAEGSTELHPVMDTKMAVEISYNHLVALIHKIIGPVDVYTNGLMYYSVPVPHRILQYGGNKNTDAWKHMGSFSIVRNNWYDITVSEITRLGTPVHDIYQPIIPVMDVKRSYINLGVELKDFHDIIQDNIPMM